MGREVMSDAEWPPEVKTALDQVIFSDDVKLLRMIAFNSIQALAQIMHDVQGKPCDLACDVYNTARDVQGTIISSLRTGEVEQFDWWQPVEKV